MILKDIKNQFPAYKWKENKSFYWEPHTQTIFYGLNDLAIPEGLYQLFHELGHAQLQHQQYTFDIELVRFEAQAWEKATQTAIQFDTSIPDEYVQECLNSYRRWLHQRSQCINCEQTGLQIKKSTYQCYNCQCSWRVNEAKFCELRRFKID